MNNKIKLFVKKFKEENYFYKYSILVITMFVSAINYNLFLRPLKIVAGGTNGLSIIIEKIFSIEPSFFILIFSVVVLILGYFTVGIKKASSALVASFVYPVFVDATEIITSFVSINESDILVASVFSGILSGWVYGLTCKIDLSQGGVSLISQILFEKFKLSISGTSFLINFCIILVGGYYFGVTSVLCAIILLYINSITIDKVMLGVSTHKYFYIITDKQVDVKKYILDELKSGVTLCDVKGGRENDDKSIMMVSIPNDLYYKVAKKIKLIDKKAFFVATDSYQVIGGHNS